MSEKHKRILEQLRRNIHTFSTYIELFLAACIIIGIAVQLTAFPSAVKNLFISGHEGFKQFLEYLIDMIIGIELIHLLCHPNLDNVVEILLIAITREIVLCSADPPGIIIGVLSIAVLFAVRKFLFIDKLDRHDDDFDLHVKDKDKEKSQKTG